MVQGSRQRICCNMLRYSGKRKPDTFRQKRAEWQQSCTCYDLLLLALNCSLQLADPSRPEVYAVHFTCGSAYLIILCNMAIHAQPKPSAPQAAGQEIKSFMLELMLLPRER